MANERPEADTELSGMDNGQVGEETAAGGPKPNRNRLYTRDRKRDETQYADLRVRLNNIDARMLERIRDNYDMSFAALIRFLIRQAYTELYDENPEPLTGAGIHLGGQTNHKNDR
jgi:hypothetical protein